MPKGHLPGHQQQLRSSPSPERKHTVGRTKPGHGQRLILGSQPRGLTLRAREPGGGWNPPLCLGTGRGKGVTEHGTLTWSRAAGLAVLSLSTETRRGCRPWNSSSPFPAGMLFSQPTHKGQLPAISGPPRVPQPTFLEALFQGIGQRKAALQQEVGEQAGCQDQAQVLKSTLPGLGTGG